MTSTASDVRGDDPAPDTPSPRGPRIGLLTALVVVVAVAVVAVGLVAGRRQPGNGGDATAGGSDGWRGALLSEPQPRPDFTLTDTAGRPYDFPSETGGRLTLLFFGYTSCPDVCPIQMATLSEALERPGMPDPIVVFVTTDPDRDTAERLRGWLDNFGTDIVGLTGTREEIAAAEDAAGVARSMVAPEHEADGSYEVGHAAQVIAYTPDDLSHLLYPFGVQVRDWETDLPRMVATWGGDAPGGDEAGGDEAGRDEAGRDEAGRDEAGGNEAGRDEARRDEAGDEAGTDGR